MDLFKKLELFIKNTYNDEILTDFEKDILEEACYQKICSDKVASKTKSGNDYKSEEKKLKIAGPLILSEDVNNSKLHQYVNSTLTDNNFYTTLINFIDDKKLSDVETYKKAGIDRKLFSKIRSDKNYRPSKMTVFAFIIALGLKEDEAFKLLNSAGYSVSNNQLSDVILQFCIKEKIDNIFTFNNFLSEYGIEL